SDRSAVTSSGLLPVTDRHKSTQAVADKSTGAVRGNEVTLVGDVLHVQGDAPVGVVPSDHRVADDISGNRIDVRRIAPGLVTVVHAAADLEPRHTTDRKFVGGPEVGHMLRNALRMIA